MKSYLFCFAMFSVAAIIAGAPAHAQNGGLTRSFVSSAGVDTNPCTIIQPCASFAQAYTRIGANGIIAALDPGKYGPLTNITTGVTINGNGWAAITAPADGAGIIVNAGSGNVTLDGIEIDGAGAAFNGIVFNTGGNLTITNCLVKDIIQNISGDSNTGNGILLQPTSGTFDFTITNTTVANNGFAGIQYFPPSGSPSASGVIDHVVANANGNGIYLFTSNTGGGTTIVTVSNSIASNNVGIGILVADGAAAQAKLSIDSASISGNGAGVQAEESSNVVLGRSVIIGNTTGVQNNTTPNTFYSYQNNQIDLNVVDITGTPSTMLNITKGLR